MKQKLYKWRVTHPRHEPVEVVAASPYDALLHAAVNVWRVPWTPIARECKFERLAEAEEVEV